MLVKCAYFHEFLGLTKFSCYFNQKYGWLLHYRLGRVGGGGHLPQMPHPGSAIVLGEIAVLLGVYKNRILAVEDCLTDV